MSKQVESVVFFFFLKDAIVYIFKFTMDRMTMHHLKGIPSVVKPTELLPSLHIPSALCFNITVLVHYHGSNRFQMQQS